MPPRRGGTTTAPPPEEFEENIVDIDVTEEMRGSYLEYAYSVIYSRALPDARDGLKPVQRRILYQMNEMGLRPDRGHVKCARVVGDVMGRLHPHGDSAIYDALVRLAQPWAMRLPLVDGHGNFGSLGGDDSPAAMRYTECRLTDAAMAMVESIDEDTVDFGPELRRPGARAAGPPGRHPEPAGQRHRGDRGGDGDQHGAAQPDRGHRRRPLPAQAPGSQPRAADALRPGPGPADRRPHRRPRRGQGGVRDRARHLPYSGDGHDRAAQRPQDRHRGDRAALQRGPGEGHHPDQGPRPVEEDHRHLRPQGPDRPQPRPVPGHRDQARLQPRGRPRRAVPAHADGRDVRHQQRRAGRRPAAHARPQGTAQHLHRAPRRRHPAAQRVPQEEARGPAAPGRRHPHRAAQHRRGHPGHPHQR